MGVVLRDSGDDGYEAGEMKSGGDAKFTCFCDELGTVDFCQKSRLITALDILTLSVHRQGSGVVAVEIRRGSSRSGG